MQSLEEFLDSTHARGVPAVIRAIARGALRVWREMPLQTGKAQGVNPSGDKQTIVDLFANESFLSELLSTGEVAEVASEELERPATGGGSLHVAMDPLDGSSNILTNNPLGSIFGVYKSPLPCPGDGLIAAAFVTYGPMLTLTVSLGKEVHRFTAIGRPSGWAFEHSSGPVMIPGAAQVFGLGGLRRDWIPEVERFVASLESRGMRLRYGGTFVGDYNQVLAYGGIFGYPALKSKPRGKLRVLYEAAPMAFITEKAGGRASDGRLPILSLEPKKLEETCPVYLGSPSLVVELERLVGSAGGNS